MTKRIYVESDNLQPLVDWLKTKPEGECKVLIGGTADGLSLLTAQLTSHGRDLVVWLVAKMERGELEVRSMAGKADGLPIGVVVDSHDK